MGLRGPEEAEGDETAAAGEESQPAPAAQDAASQGVRKTNIFSIHPLSFLCVDSSKQKINLSI